MATACTSICSYTGGGAATVGFDITTAAQTTVTYAPTLFGNTSDIGVGGCYSV